MLPLNKLFSHESFFKKSFYVNILPVNQQNFFPAILLHKLCHCNSSISEKCFIIKTKIILCEVFVTCCYSIHITCNQTLSWSEDRIRLFQWFCFLWSLLLDHLRLWGAHHKAKNIFVNFKIASTIIPWWVLQPELEHIHNMVQIILKNLTVAWSPRRPEINFYVFGCFEKKKIIQRYQPLNHS